MAGAKTLTPEEEENRLNVRVSALDWFMHPVPEMRCRPAHEQAPDDGKRLEEMKAMLRSCPVSTVSRFITTCDAPKPVALNQKKWVDFPLEQRIDINHNTRRLRFRLPVEHLGLPVGMHIFLKARVADKPCMRAYTPVGFGDYYVEFIIKVYFPLPPKFPDGGVLTQHFETLKVGDTVKLTPPYGVFTIDENLPTGVLLSAGIGVTPMVNFARALGNNVALVVHVDKTETAHAYKEEFEKHRTIFKYTAGGTRPSAQSLAMETVAAAGTDHCFYICGPSAWMNEMQTELLKLGAKKVMCEVFGSQLASGCPFAASAPQMA